MRISNHERSDEKSIGRLVNVYSLSKAKIGAIRSKRNRRSLFYGTYETQVTEGGEADLHKHLVGCKKNPGHPRFVPLDDFNVNHLPDGYHDKDLVQFIKATADLTVRVDVKTTSSQRPEFWPRTCIPYAFYQMRGSDVMRIGTGLVFNVSKLNSKETCKCHKCQHSNTPSTVWGKVHICTATHVVFDDLEARHTTFRLFYDRQNSPLVTLDGWTVHSSNIEEDWSALTSLSCDLDLLDRLKTMRTHWGNLWNKLNNKYKRRSNKDTLNFIVSHPHGCPKQVTVGQWIDRLVVKEFGGDKLTRYTYTTSTCPGSSGALVRTLRDASHFHSGVNGEGTNFSGTGGEWSCF